MFTHRRPILSLLLFAGLALLPARHAEAQRDMPPADPSVQAERAAADQAGWCVRFLRERARLQQARAEAIEPLLTRSRAIDSAMSVLSLPVARPTDARTLRMQALELDEQIETLRNALEGRPGEDDRGRPLDEVRQQIRELLDHRMRKSLLARSYAAEGQARVALLDQLRVEKQALTEQMSGISDPYDRRVGWLTEQVRRHDEAFRQAMHGFGRLGEFAGISVQAVRVHTMISEGRLTFSWTDAKGSIVASAILRLGADADPYDHPPYVHGRYPVLIQARQETQIIAGHFLIEFRVGVDELAGEERVLDAATRLLDIDGLGRLVPRLGSNGLD